MRLTPMVSHRLSRGLTALIVGVTVIPLALLLWLGWRLLEQDRVLERQQSSQRVELGADRVVSTLQRSLASVEQQLSTGVERWPEGAVALTLDVDRFEATPSGRLAYLPVRRRLEEALPEVVEQIDEIEFRQTGRDAVVDALRSFTRSPDATVRATATFRLGRILSRGNRRSEALTVYSRLLDVDDIAAAGVPLSLASRYARCKLLEIERRASELEAEATRLDDDLIAGRWPVEAATYETYIADARRWRKDSSTSARPNEALAAAAEAVWKRGIGLTDDPGPSSRWESFDVRGQSFTVLFYMSGQIRRALVASPSYVESHVLKAAEPIALESRVRFALGPAPPAAPADGVAIRRSTVESGLPWLLTIVSAESAHVSSEFASRRWLLGFGLAVLLSMVLLAGYAIVRAVSKELAVARLQSDFVAAVSHEFRTPLTALRQFTDILRKDDRIDDERRVVCYEAQSRATDRLTRLVESLLDFGRMEAGARPYERERHDCMEFVRKVVDEYRREALPAGYRLDLHVAGTGDVEMDREALGRAIWNLLDNAVKYSPASPAIDVAVAAHAGTVSIAVRDRGIGVAPHEWTAIFARFRRGEEALRRGIKGTGIGLAMVDHIVKAHRGRVDVESEPGHGSTFTIVLPAVGAAATNQEQGDSGHAALSSNFEPRT